MVSQGQRLGGWWIAFLLSLLSVAGLAATSSNLKLVDAVKNRDHEAVRSLLNQHIDVNAPQADGATALAWAAHWDDLETAELLIRKGASVNAANDFGVTPLSLACRNGSAAMVEKLLKAGADPNAVLPTGETPLMTAARTGSVEVVKSLLVHGVDVNAKETEQGQTALMWAMAEDHTEAARVLIAHGADVHARSKGGFTPLLFAAQQGNVDSARILLAAGANVNEATPEDGSALVVATAAGHEALAMFLLENGADPNAEDGYGITALHYAVLKGLSIVSAVRADPVTYYLLRPNMPELVKALLTHGANPNARVTKFPPLPSARRAHLPIISPVGATPFLLAAASYDSNLMRLLVASGANPLQAAEKNTTPLIVAAGLAEGLSYELTRTEEDNRNALEAVKLAVELGADVNAATSSGDTALHGAAWVGSDAIVQFLVDKGAKVDVKDKFGQTPWSIAALIYPPGFLDSNVRPRFVHRSTADLLLKLGAIPLTSDGATLEPVTASSNRSGGLK